MKREGRCCSLFLFYQNCFYILFILLIINYYYYLIFVYLEARFQATACTGVREEEGRPFLFTTYLFIFAMMELSGFLFYQIALFSLYLLLLAFCFLFLWCWLFQALWTPGINSVNLDSPFFSMFHLFFLFLSVGKYQFDL